MYLVTSNEKNTLTSWERRQDVEAILGAFNTDPLVFWQEIKTASDHYDIMVKLPSDMAHVFGPTVADPNGLPIPISVPARYEVQDHWFQLTKPNTAHVYDVGSAERYYGVVRLADRTRPNLPPFYVINTHFTNGCEWDLSATECSEVATFLRPHWNEHWQSLKDTIDLLKNLDHTVFYGGDFNRKVSPALGSAEKLAVGDGKIDKLAVIDRSVDTNLDATGTIATRSDHDARWANWDLTKRPPT